MSEHELSVSEIWYDIQRWSRPEIVKCIKVGVTLVIIGATLMIFWAIAGFAHASGGQEYRDVAINVYFAIFVLGLVVAFPAWVTATKNM